MDATPAPGSAAPPTPRWVWLLVGALVLFVLVFVGLHLLGVTPKGH